MSATSRISGLPRSILKTTTVILPALSLIAASFNVSAAPTVSGTTISWPDDGWYQVQSAVDYRSICQGGRSCNVSPGVYNVINLTTGKRFEKITVSATTTNPAPGAPVSPVVNGVTVKGNVISWPDDGWYQVQSAVDYRSVCQGVRSCSVEAGKYTVINHTTGKRFENIVVGSTVPPTTPTAPTAPTAPSAGLPASPANAKVSYYSHSIAEVFWDRYPQAAGIVSTDVLRNGVKIGSSRGNSYYDNTRSDGVGYRYSLVAINAQGKRSAAVEVTPVATQSILIPELSTDQGDNGTILSVSGNNAFFGSPYVDGFNGSVQTYSRNAQGKWVAGQVLSGEQNAYAGRFGESVKVEGNVAVVTESTTDGGVAHVYNRDSSGQWFLLQTIVPPSPLEGLGEGSVALSGNTLLLREQGGVVAYRKSADGYFAFERLLTSNDPVVSVYGFDGEIALDGNTAALGSISSGSVFIFQRSAAGQWSQQAKLSPATSQDNIVNAIAIKGNTLAVGTFGSAVVYTRGTDGRWSETQRIKNLSVAYQTVAVAMDGSRLVLGLNAEDGLARLSGTAQVYTRQANGQWALSKTLFAEDGTRLGDFGQTVAVDDGQVFVSGYSKVDLQNYARRPAAYVFNVK